MSEGTKDDKPRPRRSAPDLRVLSTAIVENAQETPPAAEPAEAPAAAIDEDFEVLAPAQRRAPVLLIVGGVVLVLVILVVTLAASLRGGGKKKGGQAQTAAKQEPAKPPPAKQTPPVKQPSPTPTAAAPPDPDPDPVSAPVPVPDPAPAKPVAAKSEPAKPAPDRDDDRDDRSSSSRPAPPPSNAKRRADAELAYRDGVQLAAVGDTAGAVKQLKRAAAGNPGHAATWRALGDVYVKRGDKSNAKSAYQRYLKLAPKAGDADKVRNRLRDL